MALKGLTGKQKGQLTGTSPPGTKCTANVNTSGDYHRKQVLFVLTGGGVMKQILSSFFWSITAIFQLSRVYRNNEKKKKKRGEGLPNVPHCSFLPD